MVGLRDLPHCLTQEICQALVDDSEPRLKFGGLAKKQVLVDGLGFFAALIKRFFWVCSSAVNS